MNDALAGTSYTETDDHATQDRDVRLLQGALCQGILLREIEALLWANCSGIHSTLSRPRYSTVQELQKLYRLTLVVWLGAKVLVVKTCYLAYSFSIQHHPNRMLFRHQDAWHIPLRWYTTRGTLRQGNPW